MPMGGGDGVAHLHTQILCWPGYPSRFYSLPLPFVAVQGCEEIKNKRRDLLHLGLSDNVSQSDWHGGQGDMSRFRWVPIARLW